MGLRIGDCVALKDVSIETTGEGSIMDIFGFWAWVKWDKFPIPQTVYLGHLVGLV